MASLLPRPRPLSSADADDRDLIQSYADSIGLLCDQLLSRNTEAVERVEAVDDPVERDKAMGAMIDSDECLALARERLREGFILLEQVVLRRPPGYR